MRTNLFLATFFAAVTLAGCGDSGGDDDGSTTAATAATPATSGPTAPTTGGDEPTSTTAGTSAATDETTADPTAGGEVVNGCDPAAAVDMTGMAEVTINQVALTYDPPCIKVTAGTSVKFVAAFAQHPLVAGVVADGAKTPDAASPITSTSTGTEASFTLAAAGTYPYYCDFHALSGMYGAIIAQ